VIAPKARADRRGSVARIEVVKPVSKQWSRLVKNWSKSGLYRTPQTPRRRGSATRADTGRSTGSQGAAKEKNVLYIYVYIYIYNTWYYIYTYDIWEMRSGGGQMVAKKMRLKRENVSREPDRDNYIYIYIYIYMRL
jgi:hypothetical protein